MNPEGISSALDYLRKMWPEFIGGGVAYWTHHVFHKLWHSSERIVPWLLRSKTPK